MKKQEHKSRSCKESIDPSKVNEPIKGRYININGEWKFINKNNESSTFWSDVREYQEDYNMTLIQLRKIIDEVFKDYKDPTENMTLEQKRAFDEAFKVEVNKMINNE